MRTAAADIDFDRDTIGLDVLVDPVSYGRLKWGVAAPLAGSFVEFVVDVYGPEMFTGLYSALVEKTGPAGETIEAVLGRKLPDIEQQWKDYLQSGEEQQPGEQT